MVFVFISLIVLVVILFNLGERYGKWQCKKHGHQLMGVGPLEHMCWTDMCWRCHEQVTIHLWGPYPHTCKEREGEMNAR